MQFLVSKAEIRRFINSINTIPIHKLIKARDILMVLKADHIKDWDESNQQWLDAIVEELDKRNK
jgi:hypothetical protein